jgi:hypothetical protein
MSQYSQPASILEAVSSNRNLKTPHAVVTRDPPHMDTTLHISTKVALKNSIFILTTLKISDFILSHNPFSELIFTSLHPYANNTFIHVKVNAQFAKIQLGLYVGSNITSLKLTDRFYKLFSTEWFLN